MEAALLLSALPWSGFSERDASVGGEPRPWAASSQNAASCGAHDSGVEGSAGLSGRVSFEGATL